MRRREKSSGSASIWDGDASDTTMFGCGIGGACSLRGEDGRAADGLGEEDEGCEGRSGRSRGAAVLCVPATDEWALAVNEGGRTYACLRLSAMILSARSSCVGSLSFPFLDCVAILEWDGSCIGGRGLLGSARTLENKEEEDGGEERREGRKEEDEEGAAMRSEGGMLMGSALSQLQSWDACALRSRSSCAFPSQIPITPCHAPPPFPRSVTRVTRRHAAAAPSRDVRRLSPADAARLHAASSQLSPAQSASRLLPLPSCSSSTAASPVVVVPALALCLSARVLLSSAACSPSCAHLFYPWSVPSRRDDGVSPGPVGQAPLQ